MRNKFGGAWMIEAGSGGGWWLNANDRVWQGDPKNATIFYGAGGLIEAHAMITGFLVGADEGALARSSRLVRLTTELAEKLGVTYPGAT